MYQYYFLIDMRVSAVFAQSIVCLLIVRHLTTDNIYKSLISKRSHLYVIN